ncbi:S8 family serine peptidase [Streptomyces sp. NPDC096193]|uniref:S8 family peptidase n=1 Tax=Streptomyces sp. NPDC096193 TaxID=3155821 RepID=UPI003324B968
MHRRHSRPSTVVAAVALACVAGLVTAAPAAAAPAYSPAAPGSSGARADTAVARWITLVTGDSVGVDASGEPVRIVPGKGRDDIPIRIERTKGRTLVLPQDARQLIRTGRVDERLFDIGELNRSQYRGNKRSGLPLIVTYGGQGTASGARTAQGLKSALRKDGTATVRRTFPRIDADAVTFPATSAGSVWKTLTRASTTGAGQRSAAPGLERIWLDGVRKANLDRSVPQIGAPAAWAAGYDGEGVRIAVLDSGVDETHPDLQGRQAAEANFSWAADTTDRLGHGTHVASIATGTGARSAEKFRGVAPGARILDAKVLDDDGYGTDSAVIAGMEWAASQNADIVNLSLGGPDRPGVDPVEETVNRLSAERGILFVAAAGNSGPGAGTLESPGSADAALAVGSVDASDVIAPSSGRGPRAGGGAVKPDVAAPGVGITAASAPNSRIAGEVGEQPPGYVTISGTSMATPHVAGAAALLKQQHPQWTNTELKAALVAGARPGGAGVFAEGSGRVDVAAAMKVSVVAEPASVGFARQAYPHADDKPETRKLTYRNLDDEPMTLDLSVTASGPDGKPGPAGMFTLGAKRLTVPAGGTVAVDLTADTRPGGDVNGMYSAMVTARGAGGTVRTAAAVEREVETYEVTVRHLDRAGEPAKDYWPSLNRLSGLGAPGQDYATAGAGDGTYTARLPKGVYYLDALIFEEDESRSQISAPHFEVGKDTTVTLDARTAKPISITGPDPAAERVFAETFIELDTPDFGFSAGMTGASFATMRTAQLGPDFSTDGTLFQQFNAFDRRGTNEYRLAYGDKVTRLATGFERHAERAELARVGLRLGATVGGKQGALVAMPFIEGSFGSIFSPSVTRPLPGAATLFLTAAAGTTWSIWLDQLDNTGSFAEISHGTGIKRYEAGRAYRNDLGIGVFGPGLGISHGVVRDGDTVTGCLDLLQDGGGNWSFTDTDTLSTALYRNGVEVDGSGNMLNCGQGVAVPAETGTFRLTASAVRGGASTAATEVSAAWTFTSGHTDSAQSLPISVVRFTPRIAVDSTARAGALMRVPVSVQGAAAGKNLASLVVHVSHDGKTWKKTPVVGGGVVVRNPQAGQAISFRATVADKQGNTLTQTIRNAYRGK